MGPDLRCSTTPVSRFSLSLFTLAASLAILASGCGGSGSGGTSTPLSGNTTVVLLASSTANDQLAEFSITLTGLTLTEQSGKTVTLLSAPVSDDFMHLNGTIEPLATVTVPQGIYTSASATLSFPLPECVGQIPGTLLIDETLNGPGTSGATIDLPAPITVTGSGMGLVLNLQVSKSAPFSGGCSSSLTNAVPVAPVFELTAITPTAQPTNSANGKAVGLRAIIG